MSKNNETVTVKPDAKQNIKTVSFDEKQLLSYNDLLARLDSPEGKLIKAHASKEKIQELVRAIDRAEEIFRDVLCESQKDKDDSVNRTTKLKAMLEGPVLLDPLVERGTKNLSLDEADKIYNKFIKIIDNATQRIQDNANYLNEKAVANHSKNVTKAFTNKLVERLELLGNKISFQTKEKISLIASELTKKMEPDFVENNIDKLVNITTEKIVENKTFLSKFRSNLKISSKSKDKIVNAVFQPMKDKVDLARGSIMLKRLAFINKYVKKDADKSLSLKSSNLTKDLDTIKNTMFLINKLHEYNKLVTSNSNSRQNIKFNSRNKNKKSIPR